MAKKKLSPLVQALDIFNKLDKEDRVTFAEYVKSQTATPRKRAEKKEKTLVFDATKGATG
jgi:hypothetical protein